MKTQIFKIIPLLVILTAFATGCENWLSAEIEEQEFCFTRADVEFSAIPFPANVTIGQMVELDISESIPSLSEDQGKIEGSARLTSITLKAKEGVSNFDFLTNLRVDLSSTAPNTALPIVTIIDAVRNSSEPTDDTLYMPGNGKAEMFEHLRSGPFKLKILVSGNVPTVNWTVDLTACVYLKTTYKKKIAQD